MSFRNTAILAALVALLGAYVYWIERPAIEEEARSNRLLEFDADAVSRLSLTSKGDTIEAVKIDGAWQITSPIEGPADSRAVDTLIRTAAEADHSRTIEPETDDLSAFGLAEPEAILRLGGDGVSVPALAIGKGTPIGFNAYVRRGDEDVVLLTGGTVRAALVKSVADLREKEILRIDEADVSAVTIRPREGDVLRVERSPDGWRLSSPIEARAADAAVRNLLSALRALRAVDFLAERGADAEASRGLTPPAWQIEIEGENEPVVLRLGNEVDAGDKQLVAASIAGEPQIYLVASHVPAGLGKSANDLRDKHLFAVEPEAVRALRVRHRDGDTFEMTRTDAEWSVSGDAPTNALVAKRFADDVVALEGDTIVREEADLASVGLDAPDIQIELLDGERSVLGTLVARRDDAGDTAAYYAAQLDGGPLYTVRDYAFTRISKQQADLVEAGP